MATEPRTFQAAIIYFANVDNCLNYLASRRWKNGKAVCPTCGSENVSFVPSRRLWQCKTRHSKSQFSIKVGTIFEDSPIGLDKWLLGMWMIANCKNGISSYELHRATGVSQKSAWFVLHRLRAALEPRGNDKLTGDIEADETFVGGKIGNMHRRSKRKLQSVNQGNWGKTVVLGLLEREGRVRAAVAPTRRHCDVHTNVLANVEDNAYQSLPGDFHTKPSTNSKGTLRAACMLTEWKIFGAFSSAD